MSTFDHLTQEDKDIIGAESGCKEEELKQLCDAYDALPVGDDEKRIPFDVYLMSRLCGLKDDEIMQYAKDGSLDQRLESLASKF